MNKENAINFITNFLLNKENEWSLENPERLIHIKEKDIRHLRNSLTHFFSVGKGLGVSYSYLDEKSRRLEKATNYKAKFISPEDLHKMLKGCAILIIKKWSNDCIQYKDKTPNEFKERILCVKDVVKKYGAITIKESEINI